MQYKEFPAVFWILNTEPEALRYIKAVTRLDIFDGNTSDLHPEGLFSPDIFGMPGSEMRDVTFGKLDMKVRIFNPKYYRDLMSLRELYRDIVASKRYAKFDEELGDFIPAIDDNDGDTGFAFFANNLPKMKFKRTASIQRSEKIDFLEKYRFRALTQFVVVLPAGLRDIEVDANGRPNKNEINDDYYRLLAASLTVVPSSDMNSPVYDTIRFTLTRIFHELYSRIESICDGKNGFWKDKFASRKVMDGTRNVLTAPATYGANLDSPNVPGFDATILGLYQASSQFAPLVINWLRDGILNKLMTAGDGDVPLVDKKTLKQVWVNLKPKERETWTGLEGLRSVIQLQEDVEARHRPVEIGGCYLALVYRGDGVFRILNSIDEIPSDKPKGDISPITLEELIYYCGYYNYTQNNTFITRYPYESEDSTYPSRVYVKTTSTGDVLRELDENFEPKPGDQFLAVEFPRPGVHTYQDSMSPHTSRYEALGADNDGDTGNSTGIMMTDSNEEVDDYLGTREAWITGSGKLRAKLSYDTSNLVFANLTTVSNHVQHREMSAHTRSLITEKD